VLKFTENGVYERNNDKIQLIIITASDVNYRNDN